MTFCEFLVAHIPLLGPNPILYYLHVLKLLTAAAYSYCSRLQSDSKSKLDDEKRAVMLVQGKCQQLLALRGNEYVVDTE